MQKASILEAAHGAIMEQVDIEVGKTLPIFWIRTPVKPKNAS